MARPQKKNLDYFPMDIVFDDNVELFEAECGLEGLAVLLKLWQKIYSNSYYIIWNDDISLLFCKKNSIPKENMENILKIALKRNIFSEKKYKKYGILTSSGIQKRYINACQNAKRKNILLQKEYLVIELDNLENLKIIKGLIQEETPVNSELTPVNSEKFRKKPQLTQEESTRRKEKNNIEKNNIEKEEPLVISQKENYNCPHEKIIELYNKILFMLPKILKWNDRRRKLLKARWLEDKEYRNLEFWESFFIKISKSDFLTGKTDKPFLPSLEWILKASNFIKILEGNYDNRKKYNKQQNQDDMLRKIYADLEEEERNEKH